MIIIIIITIIIILIIIIMLRTPFFTHSHSCLLSSAGSHCHTGARGDGVAHNNCSLLTPFTYLAIAPKVTEHSLRITAAQHDTASTQHRLNTASTPSTISAQAQVQAQHSFSSKTTGSTQSTVSAQYSHDNSTALNTTAPSVLCSSSSRWPLYPLPAYRYVLLSFVVSPSCWFSSPMTQGTSE